MGHDVALVFEEIVTQSVLLRGSCGEGGLMSACAEGGWRGWVSGWVRGLIA